MFLQFIGILALTNTNYKLPIDYPLRENIIENTCNFQIIRFSKEEVTCVDYGFNTNYCNDFVIPYEFTVESEIGLENKKNLVIRPYAIWSELATLEKVLDFYYIFRCDSKYNEATLQVNIVPTNQFDKSVNSRLLEVTYLIISLLVSVSLINLCFSNIDTVNRVNRRNTRR